MKIPWKIIGVFLIIMLIVFIIRIWPDPHQDKCDDIYDQLPMYQKHKVINDILSKKECDRIITEADHYGSKHGWTTKRHDNYPTTDNLIQPDWECYKKLYEIVQNKLFPVYESMYDLKPNLLEITEIFIAKYDGNMANSQKSLDKHKDGSEFSFVLALNDSYTGGGTHFVEKGKTVRLTTGDVLMFCGQTEHAGLPVVSGKRYILAGFINYGVCNQQDE